MKNRIIISAIFLIVVLINVHNFTDVFGDTAIPKFRPFGTKTTLGDSTNYVTLNKGFYASDSIKTDRDLIVKGAVVLDTLRQGKVYFDGLGLNMVNSKTGGGVSLTSDNGAEINAGSGVIRFLTTSGQLNYTDIGTGINLLFDGTGITGLSGTQQIKLPSDTASDYDANDAITLNRQSGRLTTKSLTTTSGNFYSLTLTSSLITASSHVFVSWNDGTKSAGLSLPYQVRPASGSCTIVIYNGHATDAFNGTMICDYVIFN